MVLRNLILIIAVVFTGFSITGCGKDTKASKLEKSVKDKVAGSGSMDLKQEVRNFKLEGFSKSGDGQWFIRGKFAEIIEPNIYLKSISGMNFSKNLSATITADSGVYNKDTRSADLIDNVVIVMSDGGKVFMDRAHWNASDEEISTDSVIKIIHSGIKLDGVGGLMKPQKEWATIKKNVKMVDEKNRIVTCDGPMEIDYKENKAIFYNNVEITDAEGKIYADKVIAYFDPNTREIEKVEWLGNVKVLY